MVPKLLSVKELAPLIKVNKSTLYFWANQGKIPHVKLEKRVLFDPKDIEDWLRENKIASVRS